MKIKNSLSLCLSLFVILLVTTSFAQDSEPLTLERVFYSGEFRAQSAPSSTWYKDSEYLVTREKSATAAGRDFMLTSVKSDKKSVWIKAENFIPAGQTDPIGIEDYSLSKDWSKMLIFTDSKRVWRSNTKGNYWILDIKSGELRQLGKGLPESSLMFAKFSPDEQWVAYVSDFNLFKENLSTGKISQLTEDGNIDIINGTFDWVYEEEFSCRDGFRWSPDGKSIAFWQVDATNIRDFYMINNTDSLYPFVVPVQYPKVGEDPSRVRVAVVNASNGHRTWMDIPGDQIQNYIPRMQWVGDKLLVQQLNRHQNNLKFWSCDVATGKARLVHEETDAAYIEVMNNDFSTTRGATDDLELLVKSKELVHLSEKDGWKHLHAIKVDGSGSRCITNVEYDVASVYSVMVDKDLTYFSASPGNATQRYLYSSSLSGKGKAQRLTPKEFSGVNHYSISPNGKYAIHSHSSMTAPRSVRLISLPSHKVIRVLANNEALKFKVDSLGYRLPEMIKITTEDGIDLDVRILKPANFDPAKKYPVIFYVYGEPWGQTCTDGWSFGYDNVLAEMGYVVMTMDNRGTPCPRGREWRKSCYRQLGRINIRDQAMGAKELLKLPYVDAERIGVWGWSGGGSSTLNLMFQYPDIYSCGIAVAPVANQLYYDNIYQERYMGLPQENEEDFLAGSPVSYAQNLEGDLLVIHGTGDDNVHYQGTELLINELIKHNKIFYMMAYPNRSHGIYEGEGTTKHLYNTMMTFLQDHLEPGGK